MAPSTETPTISYDPSFTALTSKFHSGPYTIYYATLGPPSAAPLIFCHGTPFSSRLWGPLALSFSAPNRVYLWDMPGYGVSTCSSDSPDVSLATQGRLFAELLKHWNLPRLPHVIAHDFGGCVSLRASLLHGARYASYALIDPVALSPLGSPFFRLARENFHVFSALKTNLHTALVTAYIDEAAYKPLSAEATNILVEPWLGQTGQDAFYRQIAQFDVKYVEEIEGRYGELVEAGMPVRVFWGKEDGWIPVEKGRELVERIRGGTQLVVIPDAGHLVQLDQPELLTGSLVRWIAEVEGNSTGRGGEVCS
jgi:pimeloyl-ACP methyl ester carboxylesterase